MVYPGEFKCLGGLGADLSVSDENLQSFMRSEMVSFKSSSFNIFRAGSEQGKIFRVKWIEIVKISGI